MYDIAGLHKQLGDSHNGGKQSGGVQSAAKKASLGSHAADETSAENEVLASDSTEMSSDPGQAFLALLSGLLAGVKISAPEDNELPATAEVETTVSREDVREDVSHTNEQHEAGPLEGRMQGEGRMKARSEPSQPNNAAKDEEYTKATEETPRANDLPVKAEATGEDAAEIYDKSDLRGVVTKESIGESSTPVDSEKQPGQIAKAQIPESKPGVAPAANPKSLAPSSEGISNIPLLPSEQKVAEVVAAQVSNSDVSDTTGEVKEGVVVTKGVVDQSLTSEGVAEDSVLASNKILSLGTAAPGRVADDRAAAPVTTKFSDLLAAKGVHAADFSSGAGSSGSGQTDLGSKSFASPQQMRELLKTTSSSSDRSSGVSQGSRYEAISQIREMLVNAAKNRDGSTMVVRMDPPELGNITLKVTQRSDQIHARIVSENSEVDQSLRKRLAEITNILASAGFKPENITVSFGNEVAYSQYGGMLSDAAFNSSSGHESPGRFGANRSSMSATDAQETLGEFFVGNDVGSEGYLSGWVA